ncbi:putative secreted protein [Nocardioidaceae bacterium Broad-1]|nr:putative secreted protein [Nocardioidaceae bacterium Broad-1]
MRERIAKTTVLGYDVMDAQGWTASGSLLVNSVKTRMVHAAVRHLLPQSPHWTSVGAGQEIPISQADILVTFHSLGTWVMKKFTEWDIAPGTELADAFLHAWNVDLHLLGVQDQYLPKDWAAAYAQYDQVMGPATGGTREGVELAQALLDAVIGQGNPLLRHELESLGRYVIGDAYADMIAFDRDPVLARVWAGAVPLLVRSYQSTVPDIPLVSHLLPEAVHTFIKIYFSPGDRAPITLPLSNRPE